MSFHSFNIPSFSPSDSAAIPVIFILHSIDSFYQWFIHITPTTPFLQIVTQLFKELDNIDNKRIDVPQPIQKFLTPKEFLETFNKEILTLQLDEDDNGCPLNSIIITTYQCFSCLSEWTSSSSPCYLQLPSKTNTHLAMKEYLSEHQTGSCSVCESVLTVLNEFLYLPNILCIELHDVGTIINDDNITVDGVIFVLFSVIMKENKWIYCIRDKDYWITSDGKNTVDSSQFTKVKYLFYVQKD
ncbi:USP domain-containing protein [Entamoeba marina]